MLYYFSIKTQSNQKVMEKLIEEVRGMNPSFEAADIRSEHWATSIAYYNDSV